MVYDSGVIQNTIVGSSSFMVAWSSSEGSSRDEMRTRRRHSRNPRRRRRGPGGEAPHKIEMFCDGLVECSASKNPTKKSTMATISSSNYWNAMALETTPCAFQQEKKKYGYDDCGVKCRINTGNIEDDWQPCQPWCMTCGYPPHICDEYTTRCTGTKIGRWFNEEKGEWIEAETLTTEEQEEEDRWNQHKFGLCPICNVGLDDRADSRSTTPTEVNTAS